MGLILLKVEALEVKILRQPHGQLFCDFLAILAPIDSSFAQKNQTALSIQLIWDIIRLFVAYLDTLGRTFECGGQKLAELQMKPPNWQTA